jgi:hypothetical protein
MICVPIEPERIEPNWRKRTQSDEVNRMQPCCSTPSRMLVEWAAGKSDCEEQGLAEAPLTIKEKKPGQRACDEKDAKGEFCLGHLKVWPQKRWPAEVLAQVGPREVLYRCERCGALYRPSSEDRSSTGLKFDARPVNLLGDTVE